MCLTAHTGAIPTAGADGMIRGITIPIGAGEAIGTIPGTGDQHTGDRVTGIPAGVLHGPGDQATGVRHGVGDPHGAGGLRGVGEALGVVM